MRPHYNEEVMARVCPHRGIGMENTIEAIRAGVETAPFLTEFDVWWGGDSIYLGHPPNIRRDATMSEALELFVDTLTIPKIDMKLVSAPYTEELEALIGELLVLNPARALVNIAGESPTATQFMAAEAKLLERTGPNILLNIDLARYQGVSHGEVVRHVQNLRRKPFSISPNLEDDLDQVLDTANGLSITNIHFWANFDRKYRTQKLHEILQKVSDRGFELYFDINYQNIIDS